MLQNLFSLDESAAVGFDEVSEALQPVLKSLFTGSFLTEDQQTKVMIELEVYPFKKGNNIFNIKLLNPQPRTMSLISIYIR